MKNTTKPSFITTEGTSEDVVGHEELVSTASALSQQISDCITDISQLETVIGDDGGGLIQRVDTLESEVDTLNTKVNQFSSPWEKIGSDVFKANTAMNSVCILSELSADFMTTYGGGVFKVVAALQGELAVTAGHITLGWAATEYTIRTATIKSAQFIPETLNWESVQDSTNDVTVGKYQCRTPKAWKIADGSGFFCSADIQLVPEKQTSGSTNEVYILMHNAGVYRAVATSISRNIATQMAIILSGSFSHDVHVTLYKLKA